VQQDPRFDVCGQFVLKHEGHLANNKDDPGGITNYGVSLKYLVGMGVIDPDDGYLYGDMDHDGDIDAEDIKLMTSGEALKIYHSQWWDRYRYGRINSLVLAAKVFDFAVHAGPGQAGRLLQRATNKVTKSAGTELVVDGRLGDLTFSAINGCDQPRLIYATYKHDIIDFYLGLNKPMFIDGWVRRAQEDLPLN
jgi:lysozyme family protein